LTVAVGGPSLVSLFAPTADNLAAIGREHGSVPWSKLHFGLANLFVESQLHVAGQDGPGRKVALDHFASVKSAARVGGGFVAIDAVAAGGDGAALLAEL
jgi:hypothetical protein